MDSALADPRVPGGGLRPRGPGLAKVRGNRPAVLPPGRGGAAHRRLQHSPAQDGLGTEDKVQRPHRAHGRRRFGRPPQVTPQGPAHKAGSFLLPPPKGSVLTFDTKGAIATYWRPGWPLRGWMDWVGRRLCRPPAGHGRACPCRGAGEGRVGRFRRKRRGRCGPRGLVPYREVVAAWEPLVPVGTVCDRPVPGPLSGLPGGVGMARETRSLPGGGRPRRSQGG